MKKFFFLLIVLCFSCSEPSEKLFYVDFSRADFESVSVEINNYVENWIKVELESSVDFMVAPYYTIYPSNDYIFIYSSELMLQFDYSGKFLRKITIRGNGPNELVGLTECIVNEETDLLYWIDIADKNRIHVYDLNENNFKECIPIATQQALLSFYLIGDSSFLCFPFTGNSIQSCFLQDMQGNINTQIASSGEYQGIHVVGAKPAVFNFNNEWFYQDIFGDTVFSINNREAKVLFLRGKYFLPEEAIIAPNQNLVFLNKIFYTKKELFLSYYQQVVKPADKNTFVMFSEGHRFFIFDWFKKSTHEINLVTFDLLGEKYNKQEIPSFFKKLSSENPKKLVYCSFSEDNYDDNPVLYIGDIK